MAGIPVSNYEHLEPWRALEARIEPWTLSLAGKKVLVVHPFEKSIQRNFENRKNISGLSEFLPEFELKTLRPPLTLSRGEDRSWKASFRELVSQVGEVDFDVALVGAGSYGLPLANEIRLLGKSAIHTAGATQLFFGLPGVRWAQGYAVSKFIDATWLPPLSEEVTPEIRKIEGGSYHQ